MNGLDRRTQVSKLAIAALAGWIAAYCVTLPMQLVQIERNTTGGRSVLVKSFAIGMLVWAIWTFAIFSIGWLCGCLPAALLLEGNWLVAYRRAAIGISAAVGWSVVLVEFRMWHLFGPEPYMNWWLFSLYSFLLTVFAAVTAAVYVRLLHRTLGNRIRR